MTGRFSLETGDQKHYSHAENRAAGVSANINAEAYMNRDKIVNEVRDEEDQRRINDRMKHESGYAATMHGHEPSKGAKIDAELAQEDQAELKKIKERDEQRRGKQLGGSQ